MHADIIAKALGLLLLILAFAGLAPLAVDAASGLPIWPWIWMEVIAVVSGLGLWWFGRKADPNRTGIREGMAITSLTWVASSLVAGVGIWLASPASFIEGWFEAMSGFTTTGATIFGGDQPISELTPGVHLWRSIAQWAGGIGIVVISLALLPLITGGSGGFQMYRAEVPGLAKDRLAPRIRDTARLLLRFYLVLTGIMFGGLMLCGVDAFNALCHAMCTVATGGFSTFDNSAEGLNSIAAEWLVIGGMTVCGVNFGLLLAAIRGGFQTAPKRLWASAEVRLYVSMILVVWVLLIIIVGTGTPYYSGDTHGLVRDTLFQVSSLITSTGFDTGYDSAPLSYDQWPGAARILLMLLMIGGGCAGSTAGGIKLARFLVAWKAARRELRRFAEPSRISPIRLDGRSVADHLVSQTGVFIIIYAATWILGAFLLALLGADLEAALSASLSCLSNIGPALGSVGPAMNYQPLGESGQVVCIGLMLLGRLEFFGVLMTLRPAHWRR